MRDTSRWSVPATARDEISTLAIDSSSLTNASATATWVSVHARSPEQVTSSRPMLGLCAKVSRLRVVACGLLHMSSSSRPSGGCRITPPACTRESPCAPAVILDLVLNSLHSYLHLRIWPYVMVPRSPVRAFAVYGLPRSSRSAPVVGCSPAQRAHTLLKSQQKVIESSRYGKDRCGGSLSLPNSQEG